MIPHFLLLNFVRKRIIFDFSQQYGLRKRIIFDFSQQYGVRKKIKKFDDDGEDKRYKENLFY